MSSARRKDGERRCNDQSSSGLHLNGPQTFEVTIVADAGFVLLTLAVFGLLVGIAKAVERL